MSVFKLKKIALIILFIIIILSGLNYYKYFINPEQVIPVWSSPDQEIEGEERGYFKYLRPDNLLYLLTRIRLQVPITYLKREIPLLAYYTPEEIKEPSRTFYEPETPENRVMQLTFDLRERPGESGNAEGVQRGEDSVQPGGEEEPAEPLRRPLVFIYHTHTSETYKDDPRSQDINGHVLSGNIGNIALVGAELARGLKDNGFQVVHDTTVHDQKFIYAYLNSRNSVKEFLAANPQVDLVLDLHRNGLEDTSSAQLTAVISGKRAARIMTVVTNGRFDFTDLNLGEQHPNWEQNLDFARRFAARMEDSYPGLVYKRQDGLVEVTDRTYNQDLHPRALLLEMGDYNNTTAEAIESARLLADVLASFLTPISP